MCGVWEGGVWDYRGHSEKETEAEARERGQRFCQWLEAQLRGGGDDNNVLVVFAHLTTLIMLRRLLSRAAVAAGPQAGGTAPSCTSLRTRL